MKIKQSSLILLLLLPLLLAMAPSQNNTPQIVWLEEANITQFPMITRSFQLFDATYQPIPPTADLFTLTEDNQAIADFLIKPAEHFPLHLIYVIDLGRHFTPYHLDETDLESAITHLWQNTATSFRDGIDTVSIVIRVNNGEDKTEHYLPPTQSISAIETAVSQINWQNTGQTDGLAAIQDAIDLFAEDQPDQKKAILYFGSLIDDANGWTDAAARRAEPIAAYAQQQQIPIHVIHTERTADYAEPFITLTENSGGHYLHLQNNLETEADLTQHYKAIFDHAQPYQLAYTSPQITSGPREVVLSFANAPQQETFAYAIQLDLPSARIITPPNGATVSRDAAYDENNELVFGHNGIDIEVALTWPDGASIRPITAAQLNIDNRIITIPNPQIENKILIIPWNLTDFVDGQIGPTSLEITLIDDLGREIDLPPQQITIDATPASNSRARIWLTFIILSLIAGGALFFARHHTQRLITAVQKPLAIARKTIVGGDTYGRPLIARIQIEKAGHEIEGQTIDMVTNKITLGRNPKLCDIQLFAEDVVSTVSGHHCSIHLDPAQQRFFVTDNHSANGTTLNSQRLDPAVPYLLTHNDVLVLGDLFRQGAQLRFATAAQLISTNPPADPAAQTFDLGATEIFLDDQANVAEIPAPPALKNDPLPPIEEDDSWLDEL